MATIASVTNSASAGAALAYADGKGRDMKNDTRDWLREHGLPDDIEGRAVAFSGTNGIIREHAAEQFRDVREAFNQTQERNQAVRVIQSFDENELSALNPDDWLKANELGRQLAEELYPDYQAAVYTHIDGKNHVLHNHIIVNKVNLITGRKMKEVYGNTVGKARSINDEIAQEQSWHIIERPVEVVKDYEKKLVDHGEYSWLQDLKQRIDQVMSDAHVDSVEKFITNMAQTGVTTTERGNDLTFRFVDQDDKKRVRRSSKLGTDYERSTYDGIFRERQTVAQQRATIVERENEVTERRERVVAKARKQTGLGSNIEHATGRVALRQRAQNTTRNIDSRINEIHERSSLFNSISSRFEELISNVKERIGRLKERVISKPSALRERLAKLKANRTKVTDERQRLAAEPLVFSGTDFAPDERAYLKLAHHEQPTIDESVAFVSRVYQEKAWHRSGAEWRAITLDKAQGNFPDHDFTKARALLNDPDKLVHQSLHDANTLSEQLNREFNKSKSPTQQQNKARQIQRGGMERG